MSKKIDKQKGSVIYKNIPAYVKEKEILHNADNKNIDGVPMVFYKKNWVPIIEANKMVENLLIPIRNEYGDPLDGRRF